MFKRILFILALVVNTLNGYAQADALRAKLSQVPDSAKAAILVNLAETFEASQADSCTFYARKALETAQKSKQHSAAVDAENLLSRIALKNKDYTRAIAHQRNILEVTLNARDWNRVARAYYHLGEIWQLRGNYAEAIDNLKKGLPIARERDNPELLRDYYQSLINAYQKLNNVSAICEYYPLLIDAYRQMDAKAFDQRMAATKAGQGVRSSTTEPEQSSGRDDTDDTPASPITGIIVIWAILATLLLAASIILYRYRIAAITTKDQKILDETVREFDTIKNNQGATFQFLTQYAYTGIDKLHEDINRFVDEQGADLLPAADNTLNRINNDVFALYGFFQNFLLLLQAQSGHLKPELTTVNVPQLGNNLLMDYEPFALSRDIQLVNDVQNNVFACADERLIDIVLRNMMSNAFKFASRGGLITLGAKENYVDVEVWVTDDGLGLSPEQAAKLFELAENLSLPGNPDIKGYGLGLAVCKALVETCKGKIWAETKPDEGFCIRFSLPKADGREMKEKS